MNKSEVGVDAGKLEEVVFERLVKGASETDLRAELMKRLDAETADRLLAAAADRIETLKRDGRYDDEEFRVFAKPRKAKRPAWDVLACLLIVIGLAGACSALPGGAARAGSFLPMLLGAVILVVNRR